MDRPSGVAVTGRGAAIDVSAAGVTVAAAYSTDVSVVDVRCCFVSRAKAEPHMMRFSMELTQAFFPCGGNKQPLRRVAG